nr:hypothetical protein [Tanacetum cinerariifolium]
RCLLRNNLLIIHFHQDLDVYPDDFLEIKSDANFDDDSFDSEGEKIKEVELLIDPLDLPCDILFEYDFFNSQDFSRDDVLFSFDNEDKVFNPGILSHEKSVKIITCVTQEKKLLVSFASWLFEDFDPPFYELLVFKEVPNSMRLLPFSSENEEKVFKPGIYTFKKFHCCFLSELSHPEIKSDANFDDDLFDSKGEKIKESELLIDQLDLPCDILSEYDTFNSQDFSRDDYLPSPDNKDKDFDPPFSELLVFKEVPNSIRILPFSSENEEKVFKPGIYTLRSFIAVFSLNCLIQVFLFSKSI